MKLCFALLFVAHIVSAADKPSPEEFPLCPPPSPSDVVSRPSSPDMDVPTSLRHIQIQLAAIQLNALQHVILYQEQRPTDAPTEHEPAICQLFKGLARSARDLSQFADLIIAEAEKKDHE